MKKLFLLSVVALVTFAACQKEINPAKQTAGITAFTATVEQQVGDTKTALGNSNSVVWSEGDAIKVWNASNVSGDFTLTEGAGTTQGTFNGDEIADPLYAFYPASAVSSVEGSVATFTLPATQNYIEGTFDNGANIAVAQISDSNMSFKNVCGVLKLQLKGTALVKSIVVTGRNNEKLNGTYTVDASAATPDMPCVATETESEKSVTLDCGLGIQLNLSTPTVFYVIIPKNAFANGFVVTVSDSFAGSEDITGKQNLINRNTILAMPDKMCNINGGVIPGIFSVSPTKKIRFSRGHLVASVAADGSILSWKFSEHQYDALGSLNKNLGVVACDQDLFGWSTDGSGADERFKPWGVNPVKDESCYEGIFKDWGVIPDIVNKYGTFYTMSVDEEKYLLSKRGGSTVNGTANARWAHANVEGMNGIILFPDIFEWDESNMGAAPVKINSAFGTSRPEYTAAQFRFMERSGIVFIPDNGYNRSGGGFNVEGGVWTCDRSTEDPYKPRNFKWTSATINLDGYDNLYTTHTVRLVQEVVD